MESINPYVFVLLLPVLIALGVVLAPFVIGILFVLVGAVCTLVGIVLAFLSYPLCAYNERRMKKEREQEIKLERERFVSRYQK